MERKPDPWRRETSDRRTLTEGELKAFLARERDRVEEALGAGPRQRSFPRSLETSGARSSMA